MADISEELSAVGDRGGEAEVHICGALEGGGDADVVGQGGAEAEDAGDGDAGAGDGDVEEFFLILQTFWRRLCRDFSLQLKCGFKILRCGGQREISKAPMVGSDVASEGPATSDETIDAVEAEFGTGVDLADFAFFAGVGGEGDFFAFVEVSGQGVADVIEKVSEAAFGLLVWGDVAEVDLIGAGDFGPGCGLGGEEGGEAGGVFGDFGDTMGQCQYSRDMRILDSNGSNR